MTLRKPAKVAISRRSRTLAVPKPYPSRAKASTAFGPTVT